MQNSEQEKQGGGTNERNKMNAEADRGGTLNTHHTRQRCPHKWQISVCKGVDQLAMIGDLLQASTHSVSAGDHCVHVGDQPVPPFQHIDDRIHHIAT